MITLSEDDFLSLETFEKISNRRDSIREWFTESQRAQMRPLVEIKARELWTYTQDYSEEIPWSTGKTLGGAFKKSPIDLFSQSVQIISAKDFSQYTQIGENLFHLYPHPNQSVIVQWEPHLTMAVPWHLFCSEWDSFCVLVTDDTRIFPLTEEWFLAYVHLRKLAFGWLYEPEREMILREELAQWNILNTPKPKPLLSGEEVMRLLKTGDVKNIIAAVRLYQRETEVGLKQAKEAIDRMREELKQQDKLERAKENESKKGDL